MNLYMQLNKRPSYGLATSTCERVPQRRGAVLCVADTVLPLSQQKQDIALR